MQLEISAARRSSTFGNIHAMHGPGEAWRKRLIDRMAELGITPADLTRRVGVNSTMVHDIVKRGATPSVENLSKIAQVLGLTLGTLFDGSEVGKLSIALVGETRGELWVSTDSVEGSAITLNLLQENYVWVRVSGDDLAPSFRAGDIVGGARRSGNELSDLLGSDIICETADGDRLIKVLMSSATPDAYDLRSFDPRTPDIRNAKLVWAAPIELIVRTRR